MSNGSFHNSPLESVTSFFEETKAVSFPIRPKVGLFLLRLPSLDQELLDRTSSFSEFSEASEASSLESFGGAKMSELVGLGPLVSSFGLLSSRLPRN